MVNNTDKKLNAIGNKNRNKLLKNNANICSTNIKEYINEQEQFTKFYTIKFEEECKQTMSLCSLRVETVKITDIKPKRINTADKTRVTIEARNETQSSRLTKLNMVQWKLCISTLHAQVLCNQTSAVIYIQECDTRKY